jgi:hypothetical protein
MNHERHENHVKKLFLIFVWFVWFVVKKESNHAAKQPRTQK